MSELRQQKQKLSRQVRDKEEEHETALQKIDTLRQDIRKAEKLRRELELKAEDALNDMIKEKKLREKVEAQVKHLESEASTNKAGATSASAGSGIQIISAIYVQHKKKDSVLLQGWILWFRLSEHTLYSYVLSCLS